MIISKKKEMKTRIRKKLGKDTFKKKTIQKTKGDVHKKHVNNNKKENKRERKDRRTKKHSKKETRDKQKEEKRERRLDATG